MKQYTTLALLAAVLLLASCNASNKQKAGTLGEKRAQLEKLKAEYTAIEAKMAALEGDIALLDTTSGTKDVPRLVAVDTLYRADFNHFIELNGRVDAEDISYVTPRGMGGQVKAIFIKQGDMVKKGQTILKLDDKVVLQQMEQLKTQLAFARDIYERRKNLWNQNIGSEVELLSAKNNVVGLEKQLDLLKEQLSMTTVYAEVSGYVNSLNVRVGEVFTGVAGVTPQITIVNNSRLKVVTDVPENYASRVNRGGRMYVTVPDINRTYSSTVSFIGASINPTTRGFTTEARLPSDAALKPNQLAMVRILDYTGPNAIAIPVNVVQTDEKGKYVYVLSVENGKQLARKKPIAVGQLQGEKVEVKIGLTQGDVLITQGYQSLYDGQVITTTLG
jgi:RND family efflux transporter MFP subunit